jgi:hypothetical protein
MMTSYKNIMEELDKTSGRIADKLDMVNKPPHYNATEIECIEDYLQGNIIKYLWRYRYKNGTEDLNKAKWYLNKLITEVEGCYDDKS